MLEKKYKSTVDPVIFWIIFGLIVIGLFAGPVLGEIIAQRQVRIFAQEAVAILDERTIGRIQEQAASCRNQQEAARRRGEAAAARIAAFDALSASTGLTQCQRDFGGYVDPFAQLRAVPR